MVHVYNGILLSHKKEWNWVICRDTDGPIKCHTEWSKSEEEKQISYKTFFKSLFFLVIYPFSVYVFFNLYLLLCLFKSVLPVLINILKEQTYDFVNIVDCSLLSLFNIYFCPYFYYLLHSCFFEFSLLFFSPTFFSWMLSIFVFKFFFSW